MVFGRAVIKLPILLELPKKVENQMEMKFVIKWK